MLNDEELDAAVKAGVIARPEADKLAVFLSRLRGEEKAVGDGETEAVRFARGFHDVFLTIGIVLFIIGAAYFPPTIGINSYIPAAILCWGLAEIFTRRKRMLLPSIALSLAFGIICHLALPLLLVNLGVAQKANISCIILCSQSSNEILNFSATLIASLAFYVSFRLPFTLAQIVIVGAFLLMAIFDALIGMGWSDVLIFFMGGAVFICALQLDLKDPGRKTIIADQAFWLHLSAAPLIVHSGIGFVWAGTDVQYLTLNSALATIALISVLALIALIVDRRAMLVAGLFYFGSAIFILIKNPAIENNTVFALTILILGGALLILGAGWQSLRRTAIAYLVPPIIARRLPTTRPD